MAARTNVDVALDSVAQAVANRKAGSLEKSLEYYKLALEAFIREMKSRYLSIEYVFQMFCISYFYFILIPNTFSLFSGLKELMNIYDLRAWLSKFSAMPRQLRRS
jgi:hypothetical protein